MHREQRDLHAKIRIVALYALFSGLWTALSDRLLMLFLSDAPFLTVAQTYKGWAFILASAMVIYLAVQREFQARAREEMDLRRSEARYRTLFEKSLDITTVLTAKGEIVYGSPSAPQLLGYKPEDMIGASVFSFIHPDDASRVRTAFDDLVRSGNAAPPVQYRLRRADGSWIYFEAIASNLLEQPEIRGIVVTSRDIAAQKDLEKALREQTQFLQHLMDSMPLPIFYKDLGGRYRGCNTAFEKYLGRTKDAIVGKSVYDMAPRELADTYYRMDNELFRHPGVQVYDYAFKHADGTVRDVVFYKSTFTDVTGNVAGLIGAMLDITERRNVEKSLRETNEMLGALVQASPLAIVTFDRDGKVMLWNPAAERIFGWSSEEVFGRFNPIVQEEKKQEFFSLLERVLHGESLVNVSLRRGRKDGSIIDVSVSSAPMRNAAQEPVGIISVIADDTERKRAEEDQEKLIIDIRKALEAVGRSKKEWQDTFDSITDMISIHDKDFNIIKANRAFSANLGLTPQEVINRKCYELIHHGASSPIAGCPHQRTLRDKVLAFEEVFDENTKKTFSVSTHPFFSPDGEILGSIHITRDITEEKEREMRMIMTERLASLGQMASGIAHEINNPLEAVMISAEMLLMRVAKDNYDHAQFEKYLKIIDEEVLRCRDITSNMLSFARQTTLNKSDIDLHLLLNKSIDLVGYQGRLKNVKVIKKFGEKLHVNGNEGELRQVFLVLLINALDAMENKGTITIETGSDATSAWVRISDTGPGIAPENLQKIFHPFFTTKTEKGGTGLGLSIAHRIIANNHGTLQAGSHEGQGAAFTITLPC